MRVGDVMTQAVETTTPSTTLQAAALKMRETAVGMLPVIEGGRPIGVVTDRDITVRATANGMDPQLSTVAEAMTRSVHSCRDDDSLEDAARKMQMATIRRLIVLNEAGVMVGVVALDDLLALPKEEQVVADLEDSISAADMRRSA